MIKRNNNFLTPDGGTVIQANDTLVVLSDTQGELNKVNDWIEQQLIPQKS